MEIFINILQQTVSPINLVLSFFGVIIGVIVGAIPGLGVVTAMSLLLPFTYKIPPLPALTMLASIFVGGMAGDVIPAVLMGIPGTPGSAADVLDGYPLAKQGRATEALNLSIFGSFIGGIFSALVLLICSGPLVSVAINFGPPEYFWLASIGLVIIARLSHESLAKGLVAGALGVGISTIGLDQMFGELRFTFNNPNLVSGIPLLPPLLGLFAFSRILEMIEESMPSVTFPKIKIFDFKHLFPSVSILRGMVKTFFRASSIGTFIGILPGAGGNLAAWMAYGEEKRASKTPERFGKGAIEGLVAAETANSAVTGGALVPLLTLGIPGSPSAAMLYTGITVQGLAPGLELFTRHGKLVYGLISGLFLANIMTLFCCLFLRGMIARLLNFTPYYLLTVIITITSIIGAYTIQNNMFHVYVMLLFGAIGYFMTKLQYPLAPMVLGIILGPMIEHGLRTSLAIFNDNRWMIFWGKKGISSIMVGLLILIFIIPAIKRIIKKK
jgi:putative tricarboxylic transport membrane protein